MTTATHDHKRGEDVRARLAALSEQADYFTAQVAHWRRLAAPLRRLLPAGVAPSPGDELILYQLLLGAWAPTLDPQDADAMQAFTQRLTQWQQKAMREAKLRSHWLWPDDTYESAAHAFLNDVLATPALRDAIAATARAIDLPGALNGLVQAVLRLTVPGVPDLYQGGEFWDYSLVDPDNRRPVDYAVRRELLERIEAGELPPMLFRHGDYKPLSATGEHADHVVAFTRQHAGYQLLVVAPRLTTALLADAEQPHISPHHWENTYLQPDAGVWENVVTKASYALGEQGISIATLLKDFPLGVFLRKDATESSV